LGEGEDLGARRIRPRNMKVERGSMAKRLKVTLTVEDDILDRPRDLDRQATVERSHY
jgi:hypothetical protein